MNFDANPSEFLSPCEVINFDNTQVTRVANSLRSDCELETAKRCFHFVRDEIRHSSDFCTNPVTCKASDVLLHRTGYCYAKSHLLAALLRANKVPAALCYQRLTVDGDSGPYCLHGLNAVYLAAFGWYRIDARGNKDGLDAEFRPPTERLAFPITHTGERDLPGLHRSPILSVVGCLTQYSDWQSVYEHLPDSSDALPGNQLSESRHSESFVPGSLIEYASVTEEDLDKLATIRVEAMRESLEKVGRFDPQRARDRLRNSFHCEYTTAIIIAGQRVGFYTLRAGDDRLHLDHFYILPEFQLRGIGSAVMQRIKAVASRKQWSIRLGALRESPSHRFYQRHGFTKVSEDDWDIYYVFE
ncbi:Transglutaminase-like superfamily protein [Rubripirellula tenax]|uniref:Transglutaminase-like superfamily protein n=1 Tax=Rubripirellula tenax TaxID=2528015 RepID=A0A5C6EN06_9BACT|nr:GNAT family N-acetyltransferase [Rubripirellula tenax]TWU48946.1 Transglutaminase-like superfamily protein [Rubripirellula tenax]